MAEFTKQHVLAEIRRTAESNGGVPLGRRSFLQATGIRESDWRGRYWARWGDALVEAGYGPNELNPKTDEQHLLARLVTLSMRLGKYPTQPEMRMERRNDPSFPVTA